MNGESSDHPPYSLCGNRKYPGGGIKIKLKYKERNSIVGSGINFGLFTTEVTGLTGKRFGEIWATYRDMGG
jgi:hypothetical protein